MTIKIKSLTDPRFTNAIVLLLLLIASFKLVHFSSAFQSDELLADDDEFEGVIKPAASEIPTNNLNPNPTTPVRSSTRKRSVDSDSDSKIQFTLEHAFGESDFSSAGVFSARLKTWSTGGQTLTKLRFVRNSLSEEEKKSFEKLLENDDFYKIRLPSNVLSPPGREYVVASVKARCLPREALDEHFVIHMEGSNILAVSYGSPGSCQYPRQMKRPSRWAFNSYTILKSSEQAPRTPAFTEEIFGAEVGVGVGEGDLVPPPEKSFWAKYWMYAIPIGLIAMNAITQGLNMPEEQAAGQPGAQPAAVQRQAAPAIRRR